MNRTLINIFFHAVYFCLTKFNQFGSSQIHCGSNIINFSSYHVSISVILQSIIVILQSIIRTSHAQGGGSSCFIPVHFYFQSSSRLISCSTVSLIISSLSVSNQTTQKQTHTFATVPV